jgi:prepilin-type N-terminal cleavage/methylation domain-containing protein
MEKEHSLEIGRKLRNGSHRVPKHDGIAADGLFLRHFAKAPQNSFIGGKRSRFMGFTLIELLIVISIIGILSAIAVPAMNRYIERGRIAQARGDIDVIHKAIILLETDTGLWPGGQPSGTVFSGGTANEIWDLSTPAAGLLGTNGSFPKWRGPYLTSIPKDPWGNNYFFDSDYLVNGGNRVVIGSFGPNGVGPNVYDSDDVIKIIF